MILVLQYGGIQFTGHSTHANPDLVTPSGEVLTKPANIDQTASAEMAQRKKDIDINYKLITEEKDLINWVRGIYLKGIVAVDTETTSIDSVSAELVGVSLSFEPGNAIYIPLANEEHTEVALKAIRAKKHVLIEKPMANNNPCPSATKNCPLKKETIILINSLIR